MNNFLYKRFSLILLAAILAIFSYGGYRYLILRERFEQVKETLTVTEAKFQKLQNTTKNLEAELTQTKQDNVKLSEMLKAEQQKNDFFAKQIKEIGGTVSILEKLSKTDKELLQKYSKVYFLNEHYIPSQLSQIDEKYLLDKSQDKYIHTKVLPFLYKMLDDAASAGNPMKIISAYRSFGTQSDLKTGYLMVFGSGANRFSADQGYSEHQLGTTIDLTTPELGTSFTQFENTKAYQWLLRNAHQYGFILSYPKGNRFYQFEPWHWRFVGIQLATKLYENNQYFYDLDQREIDTYLISIFD